MLSYNQQYDIAHGIFVTYDSNLNHRLLHSKHKQAAREKLKSFFPYRKWESRRKETFVLACIYVIFTKSPSSFRKMIAELRELDIKDIALFKHKIFSYDEYINKDINYLKEKYGKPTPNEILNEFVDGKIQFYTAWWFIHFYKGDWKPNRTQEHILRKLRFIHLFLSFKEESVVKIKHMLQDIEEIEL
jgi:hypothetical protein